MANSSSPQNDSLNTQDTEPLVREGVELTNQATESKPWWIFHLALFVITVFALFVSFLEFHRRRKRLKNAKMHRLGGPKPR